jgi:hypothetical protein
MSLTLAVWAELAPDIGAFLPLQPEPAHIFHHGFLEGGFAALEIQVVIPEHEPSTGGQSTLLSLPKSTGVANMEKTGGGRRKASAVNGRRSSFDC